MYFRTLKIIDLIGHKIFTFLVYSDRNPFEMASKIGKSAVGGNNLTYTMMPVNEPYSDKWMDVDEWMEI